MHELGVVFYAIDTVQDAILEHEEISHIDKVTIMLGEVSGVVPHLLKDCWQWATSKKENMKDCTLEIKNIKAINHCNDCNTNYEAITHGKVCPKCGSDETLLLQGREFIIDNIEAH